MCACVCWGLCVHICVYWYMCLCVCKCVFVCAYFCVQGLVCAHVCMCLYVFICPCVCVCTRVLGWELLHLPSSLFHEPQILPPDPTHHSIWDFMEQNFAANFSGTKLESPVFSCG